MSNAAVDNDVLYKGVWFGLIRELLTVVPSAPADTLVLGHAKYVVSKMIERQKKKGVANAEQALEHRSRRFHSDIDHFRKAIDKHGRAMISCMSEVRACNGGRQV